MGLAGRVTGFVSSCVACDWMADMWLDSLVCGWMAWCVAGWLVVTLQPIPSHFISGSHGYRQTTPRLPARPCFSLAALHTHLSRRCHTRLAHPTPVMTRSAGVYGSLTLC